MRPRRVAGIRGGLPESLNTGRLPQKLFLPHLDKSRRLVVMFDVVINQK
jgi:hypothetical protein